MAQIRNLPDYLALPILSIQRGEKFVGRVGKCSQCTHTTACEGSWLTLQCPRHGKSVEELGRYYRGRDGKLFRHENHK